MRQLRGSMFNFPISNPDVTAIEADCADYHAGLSSVGDHTLVSKHVRRMEGWMWDLIGYERGYEAMRLCLYEHLRPKHEH